MEFWKKTLRFLQNPFPNKKDKRIKARLAEIIEEDQARLETATDPEKLKRLRRRIHGRMMHLKEERN